MRKVTLQLGRVEAEAAATRRPRPPGQPLHSRPRSLPLSLLGSLFRHIMMVLGAVTKGVRHHSLRYAGNTDRSAALRTFIRSREGKDIKFPNRLPLFLSDRLARFLQLCIYHSRPIFRPSLCAFSQSIYLRSHKESEDKRDGCKS